MARRTGAAAVILRPGCPTPSVEALLAAHTSFLSIAWALWIRAGSALQRLPREQPLPARRALIRHESKALNIM